VAHAELMAAGLINGDLKTLEKGEKVRFVRGLSEYIIVIWPVEFSGTYFALRGNFDTAQ